MQREGILPDHYGMPGIVTAVVLHDVVCTCSQLIGCLSLALVAPLRTEDDYRGHSPLLYGTCSAPRTGSLRGRRRPSPQCWYYRLSIAMSLTKHR